MGELNWNSKGSIKSRFCMSPFAELVNRLPYLTADTAAGIRRQNNMTSEPCRTNGLVAPFDLTEYRERLKYCDEPRILSLKPLGILNTFLYGARKCLGAVREANTRADTDS